MTNSAKSFFVGSIAFILLAMTRRIVPLHNMEFFVLMCVVFVLAVLAFYFAVNKKTLNEKTKSEKPIYEKLWSILPIAALVLWMILFYVNETNADHPLNGSELIRRYFPFPLWIGIMTVGVVFILFLLRYRPERKEAETGMKIRTEAQTKVWSFIRVIVSLFFTAGVSVQFYAPNIFQDIQGGTYHSHAYTNSIINACWLIPYSEDMESLYGHYGILYMPVLKFLHKCFHVDYLTGIYMVTAVLGGISILLFLYILDYFAKSDVIFYLGMFAIGEYYFMLMQGGVFLQVHPHRMIFPVLLMALALLEYKREKKYNIAAICFITLSFIWSTEVGIVIMCSFAFYRWICRIMDGKTFSFRKAFMLIREMLLYVFLPFGLSYIVINGYNLLGGGSILDFEEFMFPLISDRNYIDLIELTLPDVTHAWIGAAILFMGAVTPALLQVFWPDGKEKGLKPYYFLLGMMGLMLMLYYVNRPAEGSMFIILFLMLVLQAIILQKAQEVYLEWKEKKGSVFEKPDRFLFLSLRVITTFILFMMAFDSIYSMPKAWKTSAETIWKRDELVEFAEYVYVQIPPNAVSFGEGIPELMSLIDRDTHLHTTEWSYRNMPLDTMERIRYGLEGEEWFFCTLKSLAEMQDNYPGLTDNYYLHEEFEYNGEKFGFFRINP